MKKLFVSCMIAFMAICSVGAQEVYIGGGFTVGSEDSEFVFQILPEVGCHLTDQWAVGGVKSVIRITMIITVSSLLRMLAIRFIRRVLWDCLSMGRLGLLPVTVIPVSGWDCVRDFL